MNDIPDTTGKWDIFVRFTDRLLAIDWWNRSRSWKSLVQLMRKVGDIHPLHLAPDTWAPLMRGKVVTLWGARWGTMICLTSGGMRRTGVLAVAVPSLFDVDLPPAASPPQERATLPPHEKAGSPPSATEPSEADRIDG